MAYDAAAASVEVARRPQRCTLVVGVDLRLVSVLHRVASGGSGRAYVLLLLLQQLLLLLTAVQRQPLHLTYDRSCVIRLLQP